MKTTSQILADDYGIQGAHPGAKVECPWCHHRTLSIRKDDILAKCFHPQCGRFLVAGENEHQFENTLHHIMAEIFHELHANLMELKDSPGRNAYSYLVEERKIHPRVVTDSMLGAIPWGGYYLEDKFANAIEEARTAAQQQDSTKKGRKQTNDYLRR